MLAQEADKWVEKACGWSGGGRENMMRHKSRQVRRGRIVEGLGNENKKLDLDAVKLGEPTERFKEEGV